MTRDVSALLDDPAYLPHRLDRENGRLVFLHCDPDRIADAAFIDGRADLGDGRLVALPLAALFDHAPPTCDIHRFIFHIGFCGSTLLSRLIAAPGRIRILREPNILADLANHRAALDRERRDDIGFAALLDGIVSLLHRRWANDETIIIKPSNWANNLLPTLARSRESVRAVFLAMARCDFLRAVVRGGGQRIAFAARAAVHLSSRGEGNAQRVSAALSRSGEDMDRLMALALVLHDIQVRDFADMQGRMGWGDECRLRWSQLKDDPVGEARRALAVLDGHMPASMVQANRTRWAGHNAKAPDVAYSARLERDADGRVAKAEGERIAGALRWAEEALGPESC